VIWLFGKRKPDKATRVLRARSANLMLASSLVLGIGLAIAAVVSSRAHVYGGVCAVMMLVLGVRIRMAGAYLRGDDISIVGFLSTTRVRWGDVERFEVAALAQYPYGVYLVRSGNGGRTPIVALSGGRMGGGRAAQKCVDELNEALRLRSSDPNTPQGFLDSLR
jgi:hypothetical protein